MVILIGDSEVESENEVEAQNDRPDSLLQKKTR